MGIQRSPDGSKALLEGDSQGSEPGKQLHFQASGLSFQNTGWRGEKEVGGREGTRLRVPGFSTNNGDDFRAEAQRGDLGASLTQAAPPTA